MSRITSRVNLASINETSSQDDIVFTGGGKLLGMFDLTMIIIGLVGNAVVLYSSKKYKAINIDKVGEIMVDKKYQGDLQTLYLIAIVTMAHLIGIGDLI